MAGLAGYQRVCDSDSLEEGGPGFRFAIAWEDSYAPAFIVRYENQAHGYLNRCAHQAIELDWDDGNFFDSSQRFLLCTTHGATYDPNTGSCISGRCNGRSLTKLEIREVDETIYVRSNVPVIIK